ncbi:unnamed protein product [Lactuca saligna]|uniref:Helitron helicase-like domain-containing protein n=1 Tax=Lactuca saligna TaxID=75948 RepID=A0AA35UJI6_LACSI|nr:unnamed protein product [Lactuca saligna]
MSASSKKNCDPVPASSPAFQIDCPRKSRSFDRLSVLPEYIDNGDCSCVCEYCGVLFWYVERALNMSTAAHPRYTHCCRGGTVILPYLYRFPSQFTGLYESRSFLKDVRAYNSMFLMTSFGANVDDDINDSRGPYVFKVSGQISHKIRSLLPDPAKGPRFLQLYLFDIDHEVENRLRDFDGPGSNTLDSTVINYLSRFLAESNEYARTFKNAKQMAEEMELESYAVRLFNHIEDRRYDLPLPGSLGCIVNGDDTTSTTYDIIIHSHHGHPQRISKLHPSYMPLQYPPLFPFGEEGWSPRLKLANRRGASAQNLTMNMYYAYHIHARQHIWSPIMNSSRLFQQYLVDAYTCIEESRLDYIVKHQSNLRSNYVSGLYDALSKGDRDVGSIGKRIFLPALFTGGPRFMYNHYLDALSICRVYGNPQYFITFMCNLKWPEISRYMDTHHQTDTHSRADIISHVFNIKVREFIRFLKEDKSFGDVEAWVLSED